MEDFVARLVKRNLAKGSMSLIVGSLSVLYRQAIEHDMVSVNPERGA